VPEKLALTVEQADDIVRRVANEISNPDPIPISFLLIRGLKETFPCDEKHWQAAVLALPRNRRRRACCREQALFGAEVIKA